MKKLAAVISGVLMLGSAGANAEFYLGGKVGKSWLDDACTSATTNCDDESFAAGVFAGYEFLDFLSLEGGYDYFGDHTADGLNDEKVTAFTLAPKLNIPFNDDLSLYGKFGGAYVDYGNKNDSSYLGAIGLELESHKNVTVRLEYQRLTDVNNDLVRAAVNSATLGFVYKFGNNEQAQSEPVQEVMVVEEVVEETVVVTPVVKTFETKLVDSGSFELNSTELKEESKVLLDELVQFMEQYPQATVEVTGYTDSSGAASYNQMLSEKRAQSVANTLEEKGIEASRIAVSGEGENNPIASNETREGRAQNRRVEIVVPAFEYQEQ
ncbi:OmpA family protein [Vibrio aquaticus]|uniref:OmpA family protein n=1 Tax=Vibrio aquaticus TaxID=2496559 RepID=A0A432CZ86_9VIBR|nr:OmpA family protein [Vibrio aquaticus]RTZ16199.1 OmpA family protein [Vibrio aquaticus]